MAASAKYLTYAKWKWNASRANNKKREKKNEIGAQFKSPSVENVVAFGF